MKPASPPDLKPPAVGSESEKIQNPPAVTQAGAECEKENSTSPSDIQPKPFGSFYETIYYWLMARP